MRVFVTGATGFVGSAVVQELLGAGHQVLGLVRSDAAATTLAATGAAVHRGDVQDLDSLASGAKTADAVIHTAFIHDFSRFKDCCEIDRRAIATLGEAIEGSAKPLIVTSGTGLFRADRPVTEDDAAASGNPNPRVATEQSADAVKARGVNVSVMRLPPSVHGDGDHGFVPMLIAWRGRKALRPISAKGATSGPPCTGSMPRALSPRAGEGCRSAALSRRR